VIRAASCAAVLLGAVVASTASAAPAPTAPEPTFDWLAQHLRPCPLEDSRNCFWDSGERGNGSGRDFIDLNGKVYYRP
jgi:hypothetical protein